MFFLSLSLYSSISSPDIAAQALEPSMSGFKSLVAEDWGHVCNLSELLFSYLQIETQHPRISRLLNELIYMKRLVKYVGI